MVYLFKLSFEKTVVIVLVLIVVISTANLYTQFFSLIFTEKKINTAEPGNAVNLNFPVMLLKADELYKQGRYDEAQQEYLMLTRLTTISKQQKATAYFKLGLCNYAMGLYDIASDSFIQSTNYNAGDAIAYNNAAVAAHLANNNTLAESYQQKAISILPAVEFHYNMGRIYESERKFEDAVKYFVATVRGQENITRDYAIDPILLNIKVNRLFPDQAVISRLSKELLIALKLRDVRDALIIEDKEMQAGTDFSTRIANVNGESRLYCKYDRKDMDPYNLIESLGWTVKNNGRTIYSGKKDEFSIKIDEHSDYDISVTLKYDDKIKTKSKLISRKQIMDVMASSRTQNERWMLEKCKYYVYAVYEQVFEKGLKINHEGYTDRFGVVWGRENNIETELMAKDIIDAASSMYIKSNSSRNAGVWADLSALLESKELKGKTITVKFYARQITANTRLNARLRVKADQIYYAYDDFILDYKWKQYSLSIDVPEDASNMTFSFQIKPGDEIKIDGFIVTK